MKLITNFYTINVQLDIEIRHQRNVLTGKAAKIFIFCYSKNTKFALIYTD